MRRLALALLIPLLTAGAWSPTGDGSDGWGTGDDLIATNVGEIETAIDDNDARIDALLTTDTCTTPPCDLTAGSTLGGAAIQTGTDDDVPESGDFGAAVDLDADGSVSADAVALGTDTTGNYVGTVTGDAEIVVTGADGEASTKALAIAAAIMRDAEASAMTVSATGVTDPGTACDDGDIYLDTATPEICFCIDGTTGNWACAAPTD